MDFTTPRTRTLVYATSTLAGELITYSEYTGDYTRPYDPDMWISSIGLDLATLIPGMPTAYMQDVLEGRALYVLGIPPYWKTPMLMDIFKNCGTAIKCPTIIDFKSEQVFRWVVMASPEETDVVLRDMNGLKLGEETVRFYRALPPGSNLVFSEEYPLEKFLKWELKPPSHDIPDDHDNPILSAVPTAPVAVVVEPPTPKTVRGTAPAQEEEDKPRSPPEVLKPIDRPSSAARFRAEVNPDDDFVPQAVTWANIVKARGGPVNVDLNPTHRRAGNAPRLQTFGRIPAVNRSPATSRPPTEAMARQMRVVFLLDLPYNVTLTNISDAIKEGSLHSIRFGNDKPNHGRYAAIIFQHASAAEVFFMTMKNERIASKPNRLPFLAQVIRGHPFPQDDMIMMMGAPTFASRRLTLARKGFFNEYPVAEFRGFCEKQVGADQIQCIWLYNSGNATAVFASVESAVTIKYQLELMRNVAEDNPEDAFHGLTVTYSKDPCLQEIHFVTDMHEPQA